MSDQQVFAAMTRAFLDFLSKHAEEGVQAGQLWAKANWRRFTDEKAGETALPVPNDDDNTTGASDPV